MIFKKSWVQTFMNTKKKERFVFYLHSERKKNERKKWAYINEILGSFVISLYYISIVLLNLMWVLLNNWMIITLYIHWITCCDRYEVNKKRFPIDTLS